MSKWRISTNIVDGAKIFEVYKLKDPLEVDHSGNREVMAAYKDKELAQIVCDQLNEKLGGAK